MSIKVSVARTDINTMIFVIRRNPVNDCLNFLDRRWAEWTEGASSTQTVIKDQSLLSILTMFGCF